MSLQDIGPTIPTVDGGKAIRAMSHLDEIVTVQITQEAIEDYDWGVIWPAAENKYSDKKYDTISGVKIIKIKTVDCQEWLDNSA